MFQSFFSTAKDNLSFDVCISDFLSRLGNSNVITPDKRNAIAFIYIANSGVLAINNTPAIAGPIKNAPDPIKLRNELKRCLFSTGINLVIYVIAVGS